MRVPGSRLNPIFWDSLCYSIHSELWPTGLNFVPLLNAVANLKFSVKLAIAETAVTVPVCQFWTNMYVIYDK